MRNIMGTSGADFIGANTFYTETFGYETKCKRDQELHLLETINKAKAFDQKSGVVVILH